MRQESALKSGPPAGPPRVHALKPPSGFPDSMTWPQLSNAAQNVADGHEMLLREALHPSSGAYLPHSGPTVSSTPRSTVHALAPPVGLVETAISRPPTATHRVADGHVTPDRPVDPSTLVVVHVLAPPVGLVDTSALPAPSTATHNDVDGHDTPAMGFLPSTFVAVHVLAPPVGLVETSALPAPSTATHNDVDGHDTRNGGRAAGASAFATATPADARRLLCARAADPLPVGLNTSTDVTVAAAACSTASSDATTRNATARRERGAMARRTRRNDVGTRREVPSSNWRSCSSRRIRAPFRSRSRSPRRRSHSSPDLSNRTTPAALRPTALPMITGVEGWPLGFASVRRFRSTGDSRMLWTGVRKRATYLPG